MTKNELMEMARECGATVKPIGDIFVIVMDDLPMVYNAILERAAVECDWVPSMDRKNEECAKAVRAMKITN